MRRVGLLVDVDGTLVDSNYHHTMAWSRALQDHGQDAHLAAIHRLIGMGSTDFLQSLLGDIDEDIASAIKESWRRHFDALLPEVRAVDGAERLLHALHDHGIVVVLATSSPGDLLQALLERVGGDGAVDAGVHGAIDVTITADDVEHAKPNPDIFSVAVERAGLDRESAIALGDSVWDVEAARRAGLDTIGVETGGFSNFELEHAGAIAVYRDVAELAEKLDTSPIGRLAAA